MFISSEPPKVIAEAFGAEPMISVFLPCTPNPTTGFYFYVPIRDVVVLDMTTNEAAQLVMSAGLIQPMRPAPIKPLTSARPSAKVG